MKTSTWLAAGLFCAALSLRFTTDAAAHCDGLDGPVVMAARQALDKKDVNLVLIWVQPRDEEQMRKAFQETLQVRKAGPKARELADRYFFETLVRVHRAGEGAPYTGLKPAGRDLGPAIPAADQALAAGSDEALLGLLSRTLRQGLEERFHHALEKKAFRPEDLAAGREYVRAYVEFLHYAEGIYEAAARGGHGHGEGPEGAPGRDEEDH